MKVQVETIKDHPDGSATVTFLLDDEALLAMAVKGIMMSVTEAIERETIVGHLDAERSEDA